MKCIKLFCFRRVVLAMRIHGGMIDHNWSYCEKHARKELPNYKIMNKERDVEEGGEE